MKPNDTEHQNAAPQADSTSEAADTAVDPVVTLEAERNELKDKFLRLMADMENLRRRTEREVADARAYAVANFARDMLNVADNVRRGIENVPEEARESAEGAFKALLEGIDLTERDLQKTLERHGVKKLDPLGQKFDPHVHQAMFEVPNADVPSGTVVQVVQSGYVIGDRVLRPALVGVAKGGPKTNGGEPQGADNASSAT
ncbi:nucleotide exchange factor GrpE [Microvirga brassicacearum]|uniref:Protein GrpE n=1 Tax=Microvirga brassicacearum TaxID=2580413 RepID=A0A5N3PCV0_9HYPH|nr:nucleotide exchange factor GrpE [Microvirga brassicacearum]KAB0267524.1 nucleotide exchange factor GrpE [Microvirga brassicacearum]